jgi:hypothetical protein
MRARRGEEHWRLGMVGEDKRSQVPFPA